MTIFSNTIKNVILAFVMSVIAMTSFQGAALADKKPSVVQISNILDIIEQFEDIADDADDDDADD